jgi:hypothetical protein
LTVSGVLQAKGGNGSVASSGGSGLSGTGGSTGSAGGTGASGYNNSGAVGDNYGGSGGNGGTGGSGGSGGAGGAGGAGGGGAGGTIKLIGSVTNTIGASINAAGGTAGSGSNNNGGNGRLVFGNNTAATFGGTTTGATAIGDTGPKASNPFLAAGGFTPTIPNLVLGAEGFGLTTLTSTDFLGSLTTLSPDAPAALVLSDTGPGAYNWLFPGYDWLFFINLTDEALLNPKLGFGLGDFETQLRQGGWSRDVSFGGSGDTALTSLAPYAVYATLVPEGTEWFTASFEEESLRLGTEQQNFGSTAVMAVPEPSAMGLGLMGAALLGWRRRR